MVTIPLSKSVSAHIFAYEEGQIRRIDVIVEKADVYDYLFSKFELFETYPEYRDFYVKLINCNEISFLENYLASNGFNSHE